MVGTAISLGEIGSDLETVLMIRVIGEKVGFVLL